MATPESKPTQHDTGLTDGATVVAAERLYDANRSKRGKNLALGILEKSLSDVGIKDGSDWVDTVASMCAEAPSV